jgi:hypothetical protein
MCRRCSTRRGRGRSRSGGPYVPTTTIYVPICAMVDGRWSMVDHSLPRRSSACIVCYCVEDPGFQSTDRRILFFFTYLSGRRTCTISSRRTVDKLMTDRRIQIFFTYLSGRQALLLVSEQTNCAQLRLSDVTYEDIEEAQDAIFPPFLVFLPFPMIRGTGDILHRSIHKD